MDITTRYKQTIAPTQEPVTLPEVRAQCSILDTSWDDFLSDKITEVRSVVEKRISRQIMPATWTLTLDSFPNEIELEILPVSAITSIVYIDTDGVSKTLAASGYQTNLSSEDRPARICPTYGQSWPSTRGDTYGAVVVTFTAGYASREVVPAGTKQLIKLLVAHWYQHREITSTDIADLVPGVLDWVLDAENPGIYV